MIWGIGDIEWDGEGPVTVDGRDFPLAVDPEWSDRDGLGPEHWKGSPALGPYARYPGFHFWVPLESGLWASVWIEAESTAWLVWNRSSSIREPDETKWDIPVMRIPGTNLVQPQSYDLEDGIWRDGFLPTYRRRRGRLAIMWSISGSGALGTSSEELREALLEFSRYGKDPQIVKYSVDMHGMPA